MKIGFKINLDLRIHFVKWVLLTISVILGNNWTDRTFKSHFGVSSITALALWFHLLQQPFYSFQAYHLLWALYWLKVHDSLDVAASQFSCDRYIYSIWVWRVILIFYFTLNTVSLHMKQVYLFNRLI
jgi:hypothetical protein